MSGLISSTEYHRFLKPTLQRGENPLLFYCARVVDTFREYYSTPIDLFFKLSYTNPNLYKEKVVLESLMQLLSFGAGLLRKERRIDIAVDESLDDSEREVNKREIAERISNFFAPLREHAQNDLGFTSKTFQPNFLSKEIVLLAETSDQRRFWIYSLVELENILNGTNKTVIIPNLKQIAQSVFQADPTDLAVGIRQLFEKYQKEFDDELNPSLVFDAQYKHFIEEITEIPVVAGKCYFDFDKSKHHEAWQNIRSAFRDYEPWIKYNIVEILTILAKRNAELSFMVLVLKHCSILGRRKFLKFINSQEKEFLESTGKLLLFFAVRQNDLGLIRYLVEEAKISLNIFIGKQRNSLLIELAKGGVRWSKRLNIPREPWMKFVRSSFEERYQILIYLLERGGVESSLSYARYRNLNGESALHYYSKRPGHEQSLQLLLALGVNPLVSSNSGSTPLSNVLRFYGKDMLKDAMVLLLNYGAGFCRVEYRVFCHSMRYNIKPILKKLSEFNSIVDIERFICHGSGFGGQYCNSDVVFVIYKKEKDLKFGFTLQHFSKFLPLNRKESVLSQESPESSESPESPESQYLPISNTRVLFHNVVGADDSVVHPKVKKIFAESIQAV